MKNIHKRKNLMGIIYAIVMCIPFFTILVRCLYVQLNKNAYQSYYGKNINDSTLVEPTSNSDLITGNTYFYTKTRLEGTEYSGNITASQIEYVSSNDNITDAQIDFINNSSRFYFYRGTSTTFYDSENNSMNINPSGLTIKLVYTSTNSNSAWHALYSYEYNKYSYLDNALEYSIYSITENNNIGRLNLVNWFADVFLDMNNSHNALYLNFVNWYMNYSLFVSCVYLLYLVLMWFLCLARRILSKGFKDEL